MTKQSIADKFVILKKRHTKQLAARDRVINSLRDEIQILEKKNRKTATYAKKVKSDATRYHHDYAFLYEFWKKHKDIVKQTEQEIKSE